jgi:hypothetical protein
MSITKYAGATYHAAAGRPVFPCYEVLNDRTCSCGNRYENHRPGKHPRITGGFLNATCDIEQIERWNHQWPNADWAMRTGRASGVVVIDVDPRNGGHLSLEDLEAIHGRLSETWHCQTGGGGDHYWYQDPQWHGALRSTLALGIDFKHDGGYVMLAESSHESGGTYLWEAMSRPDDLALAPLPEWALAILSRPLERPDLRGSNDGAALPIGKRALRFIAFGAPSGEQRLEALAAARNLLANGLDVDSTSAKLFQGMVNCSNNPDEPWTYDDALAIAADLASRPAPPIPGSAPYTRTWRDKSGALHLEGIRVHV